MKTINYSELRADLKKNLDQVSDDGDMLIIHRSKGRSLVVMSMNEYNSLLETQYLQQSKANRERLEIAVDHINSGTNLLSRSLIEK